MVLGWFGESLGALGVGLGGFERLWVGLGGLWVSLGGLWVSWRCVVHGYGGGATNGYLGWIENCAFTK